MQLFGFDITRSDQTDAPEDTPTFVPPQFDDGAVEVAPGGSYGTFVDMEGTAKSEADLVTRYREMSLQPECDSAVEDVVNESIVMDQDASPVSVMLDDLKQPAAVKKRIVEEFDSVLRLLDFGNKGYDIFRRWYVDGRLYHHIVINTKNPREGIKELRYIDPRRIRKIREANKKKDPRTGVTIYGAPKEYYVYNPKGLNSVNEQKGVQIAVDSISYVNSGLMDQRNALILGYLHKAIKPLNQLRMLEDATVIYRLARAPERRIFYIDVGNLPKMKAEQYLRDMMVKHKNRLVYDANTGEVRDDRKFMTMMEDFWLPRREGARGTEITTLPGGQNLGEMDDVEYFKKKLYRSLNVPVTRMDSEGQFNIGRSSEITRDEVKFAKFIKRLRSKFTDLFDGLLEIQLVLTGTITRAEWGEIRNQISYDFSNDNYYEELKNHEILTERLRLANDLDPLMGKYYSMRWVRKNVLAMDDEEIVQMDREIQAEAEAENGSDNESDSETGDDTTTPTGPVNYDAVDNQRSNESYQADDAEDFTPPAIISEEEKKLVESMTRFMDSVTSS